MPHLWEWFGGRLVTFWQPIVDPGEKGWRDLHIWAHVIGGVVWAVVFRFLVIAGPTSVWVDFRGNAGLRLAGVALVQATLWEMIQRENWRPELMDPPGPPGTGYPWLSAIWDVAFTVAGAAALELVVLLARAFGSL